MPLESKLQGYELESPPAYTSYAPPLRDAPLLRGAPEEELGLQAIGLVPEPQAWPAMPETCLQRQEATLPIGEVV